MLRQRSKTKPHAFRFLLSFRFLLAAAALLAAVGICGCDKPKGKSRAKENAGSANPAAAGGAQKGPRVKLAPLPESFPSDLQEYVVFILENEVAKKRMSLTEKLVQAGLVKKDLKRDKEKVDERLAEATNERDEMVAALKASPQGTVNYAGEAWPNASFRARLKTRIARIKELSTRSARYARELEKINNMVPQVFAALEVLDNNEQKLEDQSKDLARRKNMPDLSNIAKQLDSVDLDKMMREQGIASLESRKMSDISSKLGASDAELDALLK
ncbi:MAG: hypothetical protein LBR07_07930 [Puniceicoccales bacterium]|jgi:hypothetical protein|nr:hypothetical protein [Puniceicoccales bacterium]